MFERMIHVSRAGRLAAGFSALVVLSGCAADLAESEAEAEVEAADEALSGKKCTNKSMATSDWPVYRTYKGRAKWNGKWSSCKYGELLGGSHALRVMAKCKLNGRRTKIGNPLGMSGAAGWWSLNGDDTGSQCHGDLAGDWFVDYPRDKKSYRLTWARWDKKTGELKFRLNKKGPDGKELLVRLDEQQ